MRDSRSAEIDLLNYLTKFHSEGGLADKFQSLIMDRNQSYFVMRNLAKMLFSDTDSKFLSLSKVEDALGERIREKTRHLEVSRKWAKEFLENEEFEL